LSLCRSPLQGAKRGEDRKKTYEKKRGGKTLVNEKKKPISTEKKEKKMGVD